MHNSTLLCERCGYTIADLPDHGNCPECGEPITNSLPASRTGSPFQNRAGLFTWWTTNWRVLRHPRTLFRAVRIEKRTGTQLLIANACIAGIFAVDAWVGVSTIDPARTFRNAPLPLWLLVAGITWVAEVLLGALVLFLLTRLEWYGVRFFANRRGWRVTPEAAWQVCCHASIGWIFVGLIPMLGMAGLYILPNWFGISPRGMLHIQGVMNEPVPWATIVNASVIGLGFFAGMILFETLVYIGVRQCRFANSALPPTPTSDPASLPTSPPSQPTIPTPLPEREPG